MRDESAANGPAYGSLEMLGGPRKLKKKPVLVLDPEELEAAHAMFQDASAQILENEVERAPRPASILGLAPMLDDDPEEMGGSDEEGADQEDDVVSAEAVLNLTRRKTPAIETPEDFGMDSYSDAADGIEGYADPNGPLDDSLDMEHRIFPSLPLLPEDEIEDEGASAEHASGSLMPMPQEPVSFTPPVEKSPEPPVAKAPMPEAPIEKQPEPEQAKQPLPPVDQEPSAPAPADAPVPAEPKAVQPEAKPAPDFDDADFDLDSWLSEPDTDKPAAQSSAPRTSLPIPPFEPPAADARPQQQEPQPEPEPKPEANEPRSFEPEPEPVEEPLALEPQDEFTAEEPQQIDEQPESDGSYTLTDDSVDGYAFMRDPRSRRSAVTATQHGRQSALRAKLLREAEMEAEMAAQVERESKSALVQFWNWLRGLFG